MKRKLFLLFGCFIVISGFSITKDVEIEASNINQVTVDRASDHQNSSVLHWEHQTLVTDGDVMQNLKDVKEEDKTKNISQEEAVSKVRQVIKVPEKSPIKVQVDHMDEQGNYVVHVYEYVVDKETDRGHTATSGWYIVDPRQGDVESMF